MFGFYSPEKIVREQRGFARGRRGIGDRGDDINIFVNSLINILRQKTIGNRGPGLAAGGVIKKVIQGRQSCTGGVAVETIGNLSPDFSYRIKSHPWPCKPESPSSRTRRSSPGYSEAPR